MINEKWTSFPQRKWVAAGKRIEKDGRGNEKVIVLWASEECTAQDLSVRRKFTAERGWRQEG